jgi:hypothetical protein
MAGAAENPLAAAAFPVLCHATRSTLLRESNSRLAPAANGTHSFPPALSEPSGAWSSISALGEANEEAKEGSERCDDVHARV